MLYIKPLWAYEANCQTPNKVRHRKVKLLAVHSLQTESTVAVLLSDRGVEVADVTTFHQVVFNNLHFR